MYNYPTSLPAYKEPKDKCRQKKCYNCKFAGDPFKIRKLTHNHCEHPKYYEQLKSGDLNAWDTLRVFSDTCEDHEFKIKPAC